MPFFGRAHQRTPRPGQQGGGLLVERFSRVVAAWPRALQMPAAVLEIGRAVQAVHAAEQRGLVAIENLFDHVAAPDMKTALFAVRIGVDRDGGSVGAADDEESDVLEHLVDVGVLADRDGEAEDSVEEAGSGAFGVGRQS